MSLSDCHLVELQRITDDRGTLGVAEVGRHVPFVVRRAFWLVDVPRDRSRGAHAHRTLEEFVVALAGSVEVTVDDGRERATYRLAQGSPGLYVPAMIWVEMRSFSPGAVLMVLCSAPYDEADYLRDRAAYLRAQGLA